MTTLLKRVKLSRQQQREFRFLARQHPYSTYEELVWRVLSWRQKALLSMLYVLGSLLLLLLVFLMLLLACAL